MTVGGREERRAWGRGVREAQESRVGLREEKRVRRVGEGVGKAGRD